MFAIFTRLNRDEQAPRTESLRRQGRGLRWTVPGRGPAGTPRVVIGVPLILGLVALFVFLAVAGSSARSCVHAAGPHAVPMSTLTCQSVLQSHGRP